MESGNEKSGRSPIRWLRASVFVLIFIAITTLLLTTQSTGVVKQTDSCPDPSAADTLCVGEIVCSQSPGTAPVIRPDADNKCPEGWHPNVVQPDAVCFLALELAEDTFDRYAQCSQDCVAKGRVNHTAYAKRCCTARIERVCKAKEVRWF